MTVCNLYMSSLREHSWALLYKRNDWILNIMPLFSSDFAKKMETESRCLRSNLSVVRDSMFLIVSTTQRNNEFDHFLNALPKKLIQLCNKLKTHKRGGGEWIWKGIKDVKAMIRAAKNMTLRGDSAGQQMMTVTNTGEIVKDLSHLGQMIPFQMATAAGEITDHRLYRTLIDRHFNRMKDQALIA